VYGNNVKFDLNVRANAIGSVTRAASKSKENLNFDNVI